MNITKEKLKILKTKGVCGFMVSLHGTTPKTHDSFIGKYGTFEQAKQTLLWYHELNLGSAINSVLSDKVIQNDSLPQIINLAKEGHCGFVQLIHPKRSELWLDNKMLDKKNYFIFKKIKKHHHYYNSFMAPKHPALPAQTEESPDKFGCTAGGIDRFYIGAPGEVQPCELLNISFGNVNNENFNIIFKCMRKAFPIPQEDWLCSKYAESISQTKKNLHLT